MSTQERGVYATEQLSGNLIPHVRTVFDYLHMEDEIPREPVDMGFVFGGASLDPVYKAADLYKKGLYTHIGFASYGGDHDGGNASEEVILAVPFFTHRLASFPRSMAFITRPIHQRRVWATYEYAVSGNIYY